MKILLLLINNHAQSGCPYVSRYYVCKLLELQEEFTGELTMSLSQQLKSYLHGLPADARDITNEFAPLGSLGAGARWIFTK